MLPCFHGRETALSSLSMPRAMTFERSIRQRLLHWASASSQGARIQTSRSSSVVRITGIALGWIGATLSCERLASVADAAFLDGTAHRNEHRGSCHETNFRRPRNDPETQVVNNPGFR